MNRFALPLGLFALLAIVLGIGIKHAPEKGVIASVLVGKAAPAFTLPILSDGGRVLSSRDLRGRWYVLNVWGTWCVTCREEHPFLLQIQKSGQVPVIGLDWKDDDAQARAYLEQLGNPYETVAVDREGRTAIDYGVYAAPESFLVNPQGIIVYKCTGELTPEVWQKEFAPRLPTRTASRS